MTLVNLPQNVLDPGLVKRVLEELRFKSRKIIGDGGYSEVFSVVEDTIAAKVVRINRTGKKKSYDFKQVDIQYAGHGQFKEGWRFRDFTGYEMQTLAGTLGELFVYQREKENTELVPYFGSVFVKDPKKNLSHIHLLKQPQGASLSSFIIPNKQVPFLLVGEVLTKIIPLYQRWIKEGIVENDTKPDNIFIEDVNGVPRAYRVDFGLTKLTKNQIPKKFHTLFFGDSVLLQREISNLCGTPPYFSKEQTNGRAVPKTAYWGLGITLAEMVVGSTEDFYQSKTDLELVFEIYSAPGSIKDRVLQKVSEVPNLPLGLITSIDALLQHNPEDRDPRPALQLGKILRAGIHPHSLMKPIDYRLTPN